MKNLFFLLLPAFAVLCTRAPKPMERASINANQVVGDGCDGCELMYIGMPEDLNMIDTSSGWNESARKLIIT